MYRFAVSCLNTVATLSSTVDLSFLLFATTSARTVLRRPSWRWTLNTSSMGADVKASALALAASVRSCPATSSTNRLQDCILLSPAFTGTGTARHALGRLVRLPANRHSTTLQSWRNDWVTARCFIMTLRDPLERLESGVRYRLMTNATWNNSHQRPIFSVARQLQTADSVVEAWRNRTHPLHSIVQQLAWSSNPPRMQASMLRGHNCTSTRVRILCTDSILADLKKLASDFKANIPLPVNTPRPTADAAIVHGLGMRRWFSCNVAAEDTWLYYSLCGASTPRANPCR